MSQDSHETESLVDWIVRETKTDLSNADWSLSAGVRAVLEALLGLALAVRIVRDSIAYSMTQDDAPESTRWTLTLGPQLPEREARRYTRNADFHARMFTSLGLLALAAVPWSWSSPAALIVVANYLLLVLDPLAGAVYWRISDKGGR